MNPTRYRKPSPKNQNDLKAYVRCQLTECNVKLSSDQFKEELVEFLSSRGVDGISHINIRTKNISIIFDYGDTEILMIIGKDLFK